MKVNEYESSKKVYQKLVSIAKEEKNYIKMVPPFPIRNDWIYGFYWKKSLIIRTWFVVVEFSFFGKFSIFFLCLKKLTDVSFDWQFNFFSSKKKTNLILNLKKGFEMFEYNKKKLVKKIFVWASALQKVKKMFFDRKYLE